MKKEIFKVCALGLVAVTLVTGCGKEKNVERIKKNENSIQYEEELQQEKEYYSVEYYKFKTASSLLEEYNDVIDTLLYADPDVSNVEELEKNDNLYEAIITLEGESYKEPVYEYVLLIKKDKEFISVFQSSDNSDKTNMKEIGKNIKESLSSNENLRNLFDNYSQNNKLIVTSEGFYKSSMDNCETALNASNSEVVLYRGSNKTVETVDFEMIDLAAEKYKIIAVAKNSSNQIIWSFDVGFAPKYSEGAHISIAKGDKYVYYAVGETIELRDIQTGKLVKSYSNENFTGLNHMIEYKDKLFIFQDVYVDGEAYVMDINTGKLLSNKIDFDAYVISNSNKDKEYVSFDYKNVKTEDDKLIIDINVVNDNSEKISKKGIVTIDYNDYSIKYE